MIEGQNAELEKLMSKLDKSAPRGRRRAQNEAERAFDAIDRNKDGVISRDEWLAVYGSTMSTQPPHRY